MMDFNKTNIIIIAFLAALFSITVYFIFKEDLEPQEEDIEINKFSIPYLRDGVKNIINEIVGQNIHALYLNKKDTKKREQQKAKVVKATRYCTSGNIGDKDFIKDYIGNILQDDFEINETTICNIIPFDQPAFLSVQDKFEILYRQFQGIDRYRAFEKINSLCKFDLEKRNEYGSYFEITEEDIHKAYDRYARPLSYIERLEVVIQRIYQEEYGLSVADILRDDMTIDGISGGCSGASTEQYNYLEEVYESGGIKKARSYNSLWIFYRGKAIHLSFLSFKSQSDLIRICKNLSRYGSTGHLTSNRGHKLTYQYDGSRVVVIRPKFATHYAFFLRKFDSTKNMPINALFTDEGSDYVLQIFEWAVKGCLNIILTGDQNSGKSTSLKAMAKYFDRRKTVRTIEPEFELWLNNTYDSMNCICLRKTENMTIMEAIDNAKKMDADIMILGEINNYDLGAGYISLTQSGTRSTMATAHFVSTEDGVDYLRNGCMAIGMFQSEMTAEEQIANSWHLDIHFEKSPEGKRYISYINEIVPYSRYAQYSSDMPSLDSMAESLRFMARKRAFTVRPIIRYENHRYRVINMFSDRLRARILKNITAQDKSGYIEFCNTIPKEDEVIPKKGEALYREDEANSKMDEAFTKVNEAFSRKDEVKPRKDEVFIREYIAVTGRDEVKPKKNEAFPKMDRPISREDIAIPKEAIPKENETITKKNEAILKKDEVFSRENVLYPREVEDL